MRALRSSLVVGFAAASLLLLTQPAPSGAQVLAAGRAHTQIPLVAIGSRCCMGIALDETVSHPNTGNKIVIFGGCCDTNGHALGGTYYWDSASTSWAQLVVTGPCKRKSARMAWDPVTGDLVLFGGTSGDDCTGGAGKLLNDTWLWNGSAWTQCVSCTTGGHMPPDKSEAVGLATDHNGTGDVLLFGGSKQTVASPATLDDYSKPVIASPNTYAFTGIVPNDGYWTNVSMTGPCARSSPGMAWDGARSRVILFGGECSTGTKDDTWTWSGTAWQLCSPSTQCATRPTNRSYHRMAWDPLLNETVMFGGVSPNNVTYCPAPKILCDDTWTVNGFWMQCIGTNCLFPNVPQYRCCVGLAYDPGSQRIILFGGQTKDASGNKSQFGDTWTFDGNVLGLCCGRHMLDLMWLGLARSA